MSHRNQPSSAPSTGRRVLVSPPSTPKRMDAAERSRIPFCSFGQRTQILSEQPKPGPGPQVYDVAGSWDRMKRKSGPSFSFSTGNRFPKKEVTLGPGKYSPDDALKDKRPTNNSPTTFGSRDLNKSSVFSPVSRTPGPASYDVADLDKVRRTGPRISMGVRLQTKETKSFVPAPNAYHVEGGGLRSAVYPKDKCTFGVRMSDKVHVARHVRD